MASCLVMCPHSINVLIESVAVLHVVMKVCSNRSMKPD